jgi:glutathione synthase/RimK-type ligase-like ATP-grasp enzyme
VERDIADGRGATLNAICFLTPAPDYEEDWSALKADYIRLFGQETQFRSWIMPGELSGFSLIMPMIAWGYQRDCPRWSALLDTLEAGSLPVINPISVLRWNTDKVYLTELAKAGVATVPTRMTMALSDADLVSARTAFSTDTLVIKPPISGGADGTFRLTANDTTPNKVAGQRMMIQPYLPSIAAEGEYSLFYFDGLFSHAIIKRPAKDDFRVQDQFGGYEEAVQAPDDAKKLANAALRVTGHVTKTGPLAYARVDMLRDAEGVFRLMELELIEPSLFLHCANDLGAAFAKAVLGRL